MLVLSLPVIAVGFVITLIEMTEVVALVFALGADQRSVMHGAAGAITGTAVIGALALGFATAFRIIPQEDLLWGSAVGLFAFAVFLFRSTLRSYRRTWMSTASNPATVLPAARQVQFAGGFAVGAVESTETVIVLLSLSAQGFGLSALLGAAIGGTLLVIATIVIHDRIRRIKIPLLKLGATSMLFTFAIFWTGEGLGVRWPGQDAFLVPIFVLTMLVTSTVIRTIRSLSVPH